MRIRTLLFSLLFLVMLGLRWPEFRTYAQSDSEPGATLPPDGTIPGPVAIYLPIVATVGEIAPTPEPTVAPTPPVLFDTLPVQGQTIDRHPATNPDLNLVWRSYISTTATLGLMHINGDTDVHAPQLTGLFNPPRLATFSAVYQIYDWNWGCGADGCRGNPLTDPTVTLLALATNPGEPLFIPTRDPEIHAGGYRALVLYAEETRITLTYTREDTPARGYLVHLEDIQVDPSLLALYRAQDATGRQALPALRHQERFANASGSTLKIAIRDTGSFMDPRSRKDWWVGY